MPLDNVRYRFKKLKGGKSMRLAFKKSTNKVVETTPFKKNKEGILKKTGTSQIKSKMRSLAGRMFGK